MRPPHRTGPARVPVGLFVAAALLGCTPERYVADADHEVGGILDEYQDKTLSNRADRLQLPEPEKPGDEGAAPPQEGAGEPGAGEAGESHPPAEVAAPPLQIDLKSSLSIAMKQNRLFKSQRESLYLAGLGFTLTQFDYGPKFAAAVNYLWGKSEGAATTSSLGGTFGVTQLLPTNGTLALASGLSRSYAQGQGSLADDWQSNVGFVLTQPLLRGGGYDQYRESLTQGERSLVYAVRSFELFREGFVITIAGDYFALVSRKKQLGNLEFQLQMAVQDEQKNIELRKIDRKRDQDVILAKRQRITVEQQVLNARTDYKRQVESFLVDLGLDPKTAVEIVEDEPPFDKVAFDPDSVVKVALANRLDVQTRKDQLEDSERKFRLLRQDFLPDLNFTASSGLAGTGPSVSEASPNKWSTTAGVSLNIPLQQINERNTYRSAEIALDQQKRDWDQFIDDTRNALESDLRSLKNFEDQIVLDEQSIDDEQKNVDRLEMMLTNGDVSSRDLLESRQQLVQSRNQLITDRASHFIARLGFFKDLGLLFVDDRGRWNIGQPVPEDRP